MLEAMKFGFILRREPEARLGVPQGVNIILVARNDDHVHDPFVVWYERPAVPGGADASY